MCKLIYYARESIKRSMIRINIKQKIFNSAPYYFVKVPLKGSVCVCLKPFIILRFPIYGFTGKISLFVLGMANSCFGEHFA